MIGSVRTAAAAAAEAAGPRMMAWRVHAYCSGGDPARELRLEPARLPALLAPDELLVRVRAASINPIDLAMIGGYGAAALNAQRRLLGAGAGHVEFPLTCGRDFCGEVVARGAGVLGAELRRGRRVWGALPPHVTRGAHAQYVRVRRAWLAPAPAALSDAECAAAPYAALSALALLRAAALPAAGGARVLLLGLGGAGQAALRLLAARGAHVTVGAAGEQRALALALGARAALDRHAEDYWAQVERGGPYAAVLDCAGLGGAAAGEHAWRFRRYATLTSPLLRETDARGLLGGAAAAAAQLAAHSARLPPPPPDAGAGAGAGAGSACSGRVRWAFFSARADDLEMLRRLAERGQFGACVERVFPWRAGGAAYARGARGGARGKLVLDFTDDSPAPAPASASTDVAL